LKNIYIENTYAKFQREIRKIDGDTAVFVEQHLSSTRWLCARTASGDEEVFFDAEELLYGPRVAE